MAYDTDRLKKAAACLGVSTDEIIGYLVSNLPDEPALDMVGCKRNRSNKSTWTEVVERWISTLITPRITDKLETEYVLNGYIITTIRGKRVAPDSLTVYCSPQYASFYTGELCVRCEPIRNVIRILTQTPTQSPTDDDQV